MASAGTNLFVSDYDGRTALHLAAMNGHSTALEFLIENAPEDQRKDHINATDRWGSTPLDGAEFHDNTTCVSLLKKNGAIAGNKSHYCTEARAEVEDQEQVLNGQAFWASAEGNLQELIRLNSSGQSLFTGDYDGRTPLMLAAANGHLKCVQYILVQARKVMDSIRLKKFINAKDAFAGTALMDAIREDHTDCKDEL